MATITGVTHPTLKDLADAQGVDNKIAKVVEMMSKNNALFEVLPFAEGNQTDGHKTVVRTGIPKPTWRKLYGGVQPTKSSRAAVTDKCGNLEAYAEVDAKLVDLNGNTGEFRMQEDAAHIEGMGQEFNSTCYYGNNEESEKFEGLFSRYGATDTDETQIGSHVIDAGGTGADNTSIMIMCLGAEKIMGIVPKGSMAGIQTEDKGKVTATAPDGGNMEIYRSHYQLEGGISVRDWRYGVRIANIDISELQAGNVDLIKFLIIAIEQLQSDDGAMIFCNKTVRTWLRLQILDKANSTITQENVAGKQVLSFDGHPVHREDAIINAEARVLAV